MNLTIIAKTWNAFSILKNIELIHKERTVQNVVQSHYLINYTDKVATFSFIGMLWKSTEGKNTDKTSIIIEFEHRLDLNNFEFKRSTKEKNISSEEKTNEFEKDILENLKKIKGNSITLKDNFIRIDTDHIFSTIDDFNYVTDLILKIKNTNNNV